VTRATQTLAIRQIEGRTAVVDLPNVIRKHSMLRLSLAAALSMLNRLTPTSRSSNDLGTPLPILRCEVEWIDGFRRKPHSPRIERPNRWP
jgi:hypothetical protein